LVIVTVQVVREEFPEAMNTLLKTQLKLSQHFASTYDSNGQVARSKAAVICAEQDEAVAGGTPFAKLTYRR